MRGGGGGRNTLDPQGLCATLPPSKPRCSTIRPRFRRYSRSESVRFFSLEFSRWRSSMDEERCWIAATGCVDTNGGVVPSTLLRRACSWDLLAGLDRGTVRGIDILAVGRSLKFLVAGICTNGLHQLYFRYIGW